MYTIHDAHFKFNQNLSPPVSEISVFHIGMNPASGHDKETRITVNPPT